MYAVCQETAQNTLQEEKEMESFISGVKTKGKWQQTANNVLSFFRDFFNSYLFYLFLTALACMFVVTRNEVHGVIVFVALVGALLLICDDIVPAVAPFLLVCVFSTNCYDSFDTFIGYAIYAPVVAACAIFHFVIYHKKFSFGSSLWGIYAVSIAVCLGGIGRFTIMEYASGAYYVLGLSFGMIGGYFLVKSELSVPRKYDLRVRASVLMTLMGLMCVAIIAYGRYSYAMGVRYEYAQSDYGYSTNNLATFLMFAMPFPLYLAKKRHWSWALLTPVLYGFLCITGARSGLLLGTVEMAACCIYWIAQAKRKSGAVIRFMLCGLAGVAVLVVLGDHIWEIFNRRIINEDVVGSERYTMIFQSFQNFRENPWVGTGLLDDSIAYGSSNLKGTMAWYHMMIPQVIGSMGIVGIIAYSFQFFGRVKLILKNKSWWSICLGLSYFGILLMSQVNPGEFCPVPFELLTVALFILQEERHTRHPLWKKGV